MTQKELATKLGISPGNLPDMERERRPIGKTMVKRIEKATGVDYRVFL